MPTIALYVLGTEGNESGARGLRDPVMGATAAWIDVDIESPADVHLRNASLLQRHPAQLHFSSLTSVTQAIAHYDSFRWVSEHLDYSRLKQRARQKAILEKVTKTLVVKGNILLVDLTDEVEKVGDAPVCGGSFADVWKGVWTNAHNGTQRVRSFTCSQFCFLIVTLIGRAQIPSSVHAHDERNPGKATTGGLHLQASLRMY
jgi:hypothetical protein